MRDASLWPRLFAVILFATFSVFNVVMIVRGQPICECFGKAAVSPWIALVIDTLSLASLLAIGSSDFWRGQVWKQCWKYRTRVAFLSLPIGIAFSLLGITPIRDATTRFLYGSNVICGKVSPEIVVAKPNQRQDVKIVFRNNTSQLVTILGKSGTCGIRFAEVFPIRIPPHAAASVHGFVVTHPRQESYSVPAVLITDSSNSPFVVVSTKVVMSANSLEVKDALSTQIK